MPRLLAPLLLLICTASCDLSGTGEEPLGDSFDLLDAMLQIDLSYRSIEPNLRNAAALEDTAAAANDLLAWSDDPTFESFVQSDRFYSDAEPFLALRDVMKAGAQRVLDGANAADLDEVRAGFIEMKQTCVRCHKRYSPSY